MDGAYSRQLGAEAHHRRGRELGLAAEDCFESLAPEPEAA